MIRSDDRCEKCNFEKCICTEKKKLRIAIKETENIPTKKKSQLKTTIPKRKSCNDNSHVQMAKKIFESGNAYDKIPKQKKSEMSMNEIVKLIEKIGKKSTNLKKEKAEIRQSTAFNKNTSKLVFLNQTFNNIKLNEIKENDKNETSLIEMFKKENFKKEKEKKEEEFEREISKNLEIYKNSEIEFEKNSILKNYLQITEFWEEDENSLLKTQSFINTSNGSKDENSLKKNRSEIVEDKGDNLNYFTKLTKDLLFLIKKLYSEMKNLSSVNFLKFLFNLIFNYLFFRFYFFCNLVERNSFQIFAQRRLCCSSIQKQYNN